MDLKQISSGARKNMGVTWHPQLSDEGPRNVNCVPDFTILRDSAAVDTSYRVFAFFDGIVLKSSQCKLDEC